MCKSCKLLYNAEYYKRTKHIHNPGRRARSREHLQEVNRFLAEYLYSHPCVDCGENDIVVLDFDHIEDKFEDINQMRRRFSLSRLKEEIAKCEVRCANCHRRRTAVTQNWYRLQYQNERR